MFLKNANGFKIIRVTSETLEQAIKGVHPYFLDESISVGVDLTSEPKAIEEMKNLCRAAASHGVSLAAIDEATGELAGTMINRIQIKGDRFYENFLQQAEYDNSRAMLSCIIDICSSVDIFEQYKIDSVFEVLFLSVKPEYRYKNVGKTLASAVMDMAVDIRNGKTQAYPFGESTDLQIKARPKVITSHVTSPITHKFTKHLGWEDLKQVNLSNFTFKDRSFTSRIGRSDAVAVLVAKRL